MITALLTCFAAVVGASVAPHAPSRVAHAAETGGVWPAPGDSGDEVRRLQQALILAEVGVTGGIDGVFGAATTTSVRTYQQVLGLPVSGTVDDATAAALDLRLPRQGDSGEPVTRLQKALIAAKVELLGGADGSFGAATTKAVAAYQTALGRQATGALDAGTAYRLGFRPQPTTVTGARSRSTSSPAGSARATNESVPASVAIDVFPVQGICGYRDGWLDARPGGRRHIGVDIIAPEGNYVYAVVDGVISERVWDYAGRTSGNGLRLATLDGSNTYFFYGHLLDFVPGIKKGTRVKAGQIIGFVGDTGLSGTSHLHFEVHPGGGAAINPYPVVRAVDACDDTTPGPTAYG